MSGGAIGCGRRRCCGCGSLSVDSSSVLMLLAKGEGAPLDTGALGRRAAEPRGRDSQDMPTVH
eukprot:4922661-Amphidinium_carterae.1